MSPELEFIRRETERATRGGSPEALLQAPDGKWNSAQILQHLLLTYTATTKGLLRTMEAGQPQRGAPDLLQRLRRFYVLAIGRFPSGVEAPQHTVPRQEPSDESLHRFNDALVAMDAMLTEAEGRFGTRTRLLHHPVLGPLTAQEWRRFHQVHGRRHLKQIVVRANPRP